MSVTPSFEVFCREVLGEPISRAWAMVYGDAPRDDAERAIWLQLYGREYEPREVHQRFFVKGRRAGGTKTACKRIAYRIHTGDFRRYVSKRERLHAVVIAQDRTTSREIMSYFEGFYTNSILRSEVEDIQRDQILLRNRFVISIRTCSIRGPLGIASPLGMFDETGVWRVEGAGANVDREVLKSFTPAQVQFPNRELTILGTPWLPDGLLHDAAMHPFDRPDRAVFNCPTALMVQGQSNAAPILAELEIEKANDPENFAAAFECQWLSNRDEFLADTDISAANRGRREQPPVAGKQYVIVADASSLVGRDRFTALGGHAEGDVAVVDFIRSWSTSPVAQVCDELAALRKLYSANGIVVDQYGFTFLRELMLQRGRLSILREASPSHTACGPISARRQDGAKRTMFASL